LRVLLHLLWVLLVLLWGVLVVRCWRRGWWVALVCMILLLVLLVLLGRVLLVGALMASNILGRVLRPHLHREGLVLLRVLWSGGAVVALG